MKSLKEILDATPPTKKEITKVFNEIKKASDQNTPKQELYKLSYSTNYKVLVAVASNINTSTETLDEMFERRGDTQIAEWIGMNPRTSSETLDKIAKLNNDDFYSAVCLNKNAKYSTLEYMKKTVNDQHISEKIKGEIERRDARLSFAIAYLNIPVKLAKEYRDNGNIPL